jgi:mannose-1-phosphate guanylyltransferase
MFGFDIDFLLEEFRVNAPETIAPFDSLTKPGSEASVAQEGVAVITAWEGLAEAYAATPKISIDYAIAEKCRTRLWL